MSGIWKGKKVAVLMGGISKEREISLKTGGAISGGLKRLGYDIREVDVGGGAELVAQLEDMKPDVAVVALHGKFGEDGCIQGMLELLGLPYTGSGVLASSISMHKVKAKELFRLHNLPTPPYYVMERDGFVDLEQVHGAFGFPVVVKPAGEGSSVGVSLAEDLDDLEAACEDAFEFDNAILVERYIPGKEVHVGILGDRALGAVEVVPHRPIFDYQAKCTPGHAEYHLPPRLSPERQHGILTQALRAHQALGCTGATRVNMIVSDLGNEYLLEVNTSPGLTENSLLPKIAGHAGLPFEDLVEAILADASLRASGSVDQGDRRVRRASFSGPERRATAGCAPH